MNSFLCFYLCWRRAAQTGRAGRRLPTPEILYKRKQISNLVISDLVFSRSLLYFFILSFVSVIIHRKFTLTLIENGFIIMDSLSYIDLYVTGIRLFLLNKSWVSALVLESGALETPWKWATTLEKPLNFASTRVRTPW